LIIPSEITSNNPAEFPVLPGRSRPDKLKRHGHWHFRFKQQKARVQKQDEAQGLELTGSNTNNRIHLNILEILDVQSS